jgi:amidase
MDRGSATPAELGMKLAEYAALDGFGLAALAAAGAVSSRELCETMLRAIDAVNPRLNGVIETFRDRVPAQDAKFDGPFGGVPFLIKDVPMDAGVRSEIGSQLARGYTLPHDQEVMHRFRAAGFVNLGRTTTSELALAALTVCRLTGATRNPWDPSRSTAGSSGGAAAMVAAGVLPIAHAADGGGSIRNPASFCGLVGLKPSRGRISAAPDWGQCMSGLSVNFVLTRTVRDCAASLDAVAGPAPGDPYVIPPPPGCYLDAIAAAPKRLRIALNHRVWSGLPLDRQVSAALSRTGHLLQSLGHTVEEASPAFDYEPYLDAQITLWAAYTAQTVDDIARHTGRIPALDTLQSTTLAMYELGRRLSAVDFIEAELRYNVTTRQVARLFETYDMLVTPTCTVTPMPIETTDLDKPDATARDFFDHLAPIETFTALFNATGQPALSVPLMQSDDGLPIGIQLVGRFGADDTILSLARTLEQAAPWDRRPPVFVG